MHKGILSKGFELVLLTALFGLTACVRMHQPVVAPVDSYPATTAVYADNASNHYMNAPVAKNVVYMANDTYKPSPIVIHQGQTVTWVNDNSEAHSVTGKGFNSGKLNPGQSFTHVFNHRGTYHYHCEYHPNMKGVVVVK